MFRLHKFTTPLQPYDLWKSGLPPVSLRELHIQIIKVGKEFISTLLTCLMWWFPIWILWYHVTGSVYTRTAQFCDSVSKTADHCRLCRNLSTPVNINMTCSFTDIYSYDNALAGRFIFVKQNFCLPTVFSLWSLSPQEPSGRYIFDRRHAKSCLAGHRSVSITISNFQ